MNEQTCRYLAERIHPPVFWGKALREEKVKTTTALLISWAADIQRVTLQGFLEGINHYREGPGSTKVVVTDLVKK